MALKDWKKFSKDYWVNNKEARGLIIYERISDSDPFKKVWAVQIGSKKSLYDYDHKIFKTKSTALKYAKSYMRKN